SSLWHATPPAASQPWVEVLGSRQSPGCRRCGRWLRTKAPSLRRRYPVSAVLWACPTPPAARPVPRGHPVGSRIHRRGSPVLRRLPDADMPSPLPRWDRRRDRVAPRSATAAAFPVSMAGRLPRYTFRGLLGVHACYGLSARGVASATLCIEGFGRF